MSKIVLAIDPGKKKCGIAIVDKQLKFMEGEVVNNEELLHKVKIYLDRYKIKNIVIGSGTNSENIYNLIKKEFPNSMLTKVIEKNTTMQARRRYFDFHPPTGLLKIFPISFRIPPRPYDDFAALIIAERFFRDYPDNCKHL